MFHNTIVKQLAAKFLSTMMFKNANAAKNTLMTNIANTFHATTGNILAVNKDATLLAHKLMLVAANNK
jgi:hypothetical protein